MLNRDGLNSLLGLHPDEKSPLVLIYCHLQNKRLHLACEFIFHHVLGCHYKLTNSEEEFKLSTQPRINYTSQRTPEGIWVRPSGLLEETGILRSSPEITIVSDQFFLFSNGSEFGFDLFSAVFFMISRMEEWGDFKKDLHGRFEASESILFDKGFHLKPVTDQWIAFLKVQLEKKWPEVKFPAKKFKVISTLDIDNLYAFKGKGLLRTVGAGLRDILKGDLKQFLLRLKVLTAKEKDPFDIYAEVGDLCFEKQIPLFCFFLFRSGTAYDRTLSPDSRFFAEVIGILKKNLAVAGLHPSYFSHSDEDLLKKELQLMTKAAGSPICFSRQHYLRFDIRKTPAQLFRQGITADFTMGYASSPGFRAGTAYPFYHYDFETEQKLNLLHVPFCVMDGAYSVYNDPDTGKALSEMLELAAEVEKTGGFFISVFHERSFYNHLYKGFGSLYKKLHQELLR